MENQKHIVLRALTGWFGAFVLALSAGTISELHWWPWPLAMLALATTMLLLARYGIGSLLTQLGALPVRVQSWWHNTELPCPWCPWRT